MGLFGRDKGDVEFRLNMLESQFTTHLEQFKSFMETQMKTKQQLEETQVVVSKLIDSQTRHKRAVDFFLAHGVVKDEFKNDFYAMVDELKGEVKE